MTFGWRASEADDALQVDVYLESLLAAHERSPSPLRDDAAAEDLQPAERRAARLLADHMLRFHPSFRFEEALAARLRAVADRSSPRVPAEATVLPFPDPAEASSAMAAIGVTDEDAADEAALEAAAQRERLAALERRRVLIGGAIASGFSLAGAAFVAWRASTPPRSAFGRATRAAHRNRSSMRGRA